MTTTLALLNRIGRLERLASTIATELETMRAEVEASARSTRGRPDEVVAAVAATLVIKAADITGRGRTGVVFKARSIVCLILREVACMSYPAIGKYLGRDHSSVIHAVRSARELIATSGHAPWASRSYGAAYAAGVAAWDVDIRPMVEGDGDAAPQAAC